MIVTQQDPLTFAPAIRYEAEDVVDAATSTETVTFGGMNFIATTSEFSHHRYLLFGRNIESLTVLSATAAVALSSDLVLTREPGNAALTDVIFTNGRGLSDSVTLDFQSFAGSIAYSNPQSLVADSYAEYSWERVSAIFDALDDNTSENHRVFDSGFNRRQTGVIPHSSLTCQSVNSTVGGAKRFTAITRRHVIGCGHYGMHPVSSPCYFRDTNNNVVTRTVVRSYNCLVGPYGINSDIEIWLLDSDLPESITPAPIIGDWVYNLTGTSSVFTYHENCFGFVAYNQDGHIAPFQRAFNEAVPVSNYSSAVVGGVTLTGRDFGFYGLFPPPTLEGVTWGPAFDHNFRAGDSGSPVFYPVTGGWALGGLVAGERWLAAGLNALIQAVDTLHGIDTNYTVTVAPDPTL